MIDIHFNIPSTSFSEWQNYTHSVAHRKEVAPWISPHQIFRPRVMTAIFKNLWNCRMLEIKNVASNRNSIRSKNVIHLPLEQYDSDENWKVKHINLSNFLYSTPYFSVSHSHSIVYFFLCRVILVCCAQLAVEEFTHMHILRANSLLFINVIHAVLAT